jgi:hypothetical protein
MTEQEYEVRKVANGFIVTPVPGFAERRDGMAPEDIYVFSTWAEAAAWLGEAFAEFSWGKSK